jgi:hypothetical protein
MYVGLYCVHLKKQLVHILVFNSQTSFQYVLRTRNRQYTLMEAKDLISDTTIWGVSCAVIYQTTAD